MEFFNNPIFVFIGILIASFAFAYGMKCVNDKCLIKFFRLLKHKK